MSNDNLVGPLELRLSGDGKSYSVAGCDEDATYVCIPKIHNGLPVTAIERKAFKRCEDLTEVYVCDGLVRISSFAFSGCSNLEKINLPSEVKTVGAFAFKGCRKLVIYAEENEKPQGFNMLWKPALCPVVWGSRGFSFANWKSEDLGAVAYDDDSVATKDNSTRFLSDEMIGRLDKAVVLLEKGKWRAAKNAYTEIITDYPDAYDGYLGVFLATFRVRAMSDLEHCKRKFEESPEYISLMQRLDVDTYNSITVHERKAKERRAGIKLDRELKTRERLQRVCDTVKKPLIGLAALVKSAAVSFFRWMRDDALPAIGQAIAVPFVFTWRLITQLAESVIDWVRDDGLSDLGYLLATPFRFLWERIKDLAEWLKDDGFAKIGHAIAVPFVFLWERLKDFYDWLTDDGYTKIAGLILLPFLLLWRACVAIYEWLRYDAFPAIKDAASGATSFGGKIGRGLKLFLKIYWVLIVLSMIQIWLPIFLVLRVLGRDVRFFIFF